MKKRTVLITGASSGIGLEFANIFGKEGFNLILVARNEEKLKVMSEDIKKNCKVIVDYIQMDLSTQDSGMNLYNEVKKRKLKVNILINNAGFGVWGKFSETKLEEEMKLMNLNIVTLVTLTKLFLQDMLKEDNGKILNIASTAAFQPGPQMSLYYASKSFVLSFSEAISEEIKATNVSITTLCPGPTKTNFDKATNAPKIRLFDERQGIMNAYEVAQVGYTALMENKRTVIAGTQNMILANLTKFVPKSILLKVVNYLDSEVKE